MPQLWSWRAFFACFVTQSAALYVGLDYGDCLFSIIKITPVYKYWCIHMLNLL